jgi:hypothetical protein
VLGDENLDKIKRCDDLGNCPKNIQSISIAKIIAHEDYSSKTGKNDIALIKLASPANLAGNYNLKRFLQFLTFLKISKTK